MAADKISRSVPAPGQGVLSFARQTPEAFHSPLLGMKHRRREMEDAIERANLWRTARMHEAYHSANKHARFDAHPNALQNVKHDGACNGTPSSTTISAINRSTDAQIKEIQKLWGNDFRQQNPEISPLQAALATWGLTVDSIDFASLHATSTKANDKNEPDIINKQMCHLGRTLGNPLLAICQKSITGHPKAPAAAFMLNGCLQALNTGLIPGNRNADNVDPLLSAFPHLTFPTRSIQTRSLTAFSLTSFGFGQKGGQLIGIHPRYLYGAINRASFEKYAALVEERTKLCNRTYLYAMLENRIVACKATPQYDLADQDTVLLDPNSRISAQTPQGQQWRYEIAKEKAYRHQSGTASETGHITSECDDTATSQGQANTPLTSKTSDSGGEILTTKALLEDMAARIECNQNIRVGIDVEDTLVTGDPDVEEVFAQRNYTAEERAIISRSADPIRTMTGR